MGTETIKWFKIKCSAYEQEFGIKLWREWRILSHKLNHII
jgi:hypothetical protein